MKCLYCNGYRTIGSNKTIGLIVEFLFTILTTIISTYITADVVNIATRY